MKAATAAVHTHACVPCSACLSRGLRLWRPAAALQATDWLLVPGTTRSLRPAARAAWERSAEGALWFMLFVACCEHGRCFSKRRNSNDEGHNGGGTHPRVCSVLGLPTCRWLRPWRPAVVPQATDWLPAPLLTSLSPSSCPRSVGEQCRGRTVVHAIRRVL